MITSTAQLIGALKTGDLGPSLVLSPAFLAGKLAKVYPKTPVIIDGGGAVISTAMKWEYFSNITLRNVEFAVTPTFSSFENFTLENVKAAGVRLKDGKQLLAQRCIWTGNVALGGITGGVVDNCTTWYSPSDSYTSVDNCDLVFSNLTRFGRTYAKGAHPDFIQSRAVTKVNRGITIRNIRVELNGQLFPFQADSAGTFADVDIQDVQAAVGFSDGFNGRRIDGLTIGNVHINQLEGDATRPTFTVENCARVVDLGNNTLMGKPVRFA